MAILDAKDGVKLLNRLFLHILCFHLNAEIFSAISQISQSELVN